MLCDPKHRLCLTSQASDPWFWIFPQRWCFCLPQTLACSPSSKSSAGGIREFHNKQQWFQEMLMRHFTMNRIRHWTSFWSIFHIVAGFLLGSYISWKENSHLMEAAHFRCPCTGTESGTCKKPRLFWGCALFYPRSNQRQCLIKLSTPSHPTRLACLIRIWKSDPIQVFSVT